MTTELDQRDTPPAMIPCSLPAGRTIHTTLFLALRDMRQANGRNVVTGGGNGNDSSIGLVLGMIVLDTLSGRTEPVRKRWQRLLNDNGVPDNEDFIVIYALRNSLLHGYGPPVPDRYLTRRVLLTGDQAGPAVDTDTAGLALVSVPLFCARLVERIATAKQADWDISLVAGEDRINTAHPPPSRRSQSRRVSPDNRPDLGTAN